MPKKIKVKLEDLQNLWKELDDLHTGMVELEEKACVMLDETQLAEIEELSLAIQNYRKAAKAALGSTRKILGMEEG